MSTPYIRRVAFHGDDFELTEPNISPAATRAVGVMDAFIQSLMIALVLLNPFAYGERDQLGMEIVVAVAGLIAIALSVRCVLLRTWPPIGKPMTVIILSFVLLALLQWIPLPKTFLRILSPSTFSLDQTLLDHQPGWTDRSTWPLTFYPFATHRQILLVLCIATVFVATVTIYQRRGQIVRLLSAIAIAGAAVALFALAQNIVGSDNLYWIHQPRQKNCSPFANYSEFSQFMNLSIGAMIALLALKPFAASGRMRRAFVIRIALWSAIALSAIVIVFALSRNGIISMLVAGVITVAAFALRRTIKPRTAIALVAIAAAMMVVLYVSSDAINHKLTTLSQPERSYSKRWDILVSLTDAWKRFPIFGTGLGTFEYVYPMFDRPLRITEYLSHAENEYAQMLTEMGILGSLAIAGFLFLIGRAYRRCVRRRDDLFSASVGLGYGVIAILIHSFTDFSQHTPGIAWLTAISAGLIFRMGRPTLSAASPAPLSHLHPRWHILAWLIPAGVAVLGVSALLWINPLRIAQSRFDRTRAFFPPIAKSDAPLRDEEYTEILADSAAAAQAEPHEVKFLYWATQYQWMAIRHTAGADVGNVLITEDILRQVRALMAGYYQARLACPTWRYNYLTAAQIESTILNDPAAGDEFRRAVLTARMDPDALMGAARYDLHDGLPEAAAEKLRRLPPDFAERVLSLLLSEYTSAPTLLATAQGNTDLLHRLATLTDEQGGNADLRKQADDDLLPLLEQRCIRPDAAPSDLAMLADLFAAGDHLPDALDCYTRALAKEPDHLQWRMGLAKVLERVGYHAQALREATRCVADHPESAEAKTLLLNLQQ